MNKAKRLVMVLAVLAALIAPVLAAQTMSVTWKWSHDDQNVSYYRYQLNNESEEGWTVVPNTVLSYDATELDPYQSYTLYLQCSYDGENWSESAVAVAEPLLVEEPEPVVVEEIVEEEPVVVEAPVEEEPVVIVEEEPVVIVEAPVEEDEIVVEEKEDATAVVEKKAQYNYGYKTNLLISGGASTNVTFDKFSLDGAFPRFSLALDLQNIVHAGHWGLGLRFDVNTILEPREQKWSNFDIKDTFKIGTIWYDSSVDAKLMMYFGNDGFDFYLGGGAGYSIINPYFEKEDNQETFGHSLGNVGIFSSAWFASANVGMRFRVTDTFSLGLEANYRYLLPAKKSTASADLVLGFTF